LTQEPELSIKDLIEVIEGLAVSLDSLTTLMYVQTQRIIDYIDAVSPSSTSSLQPIQKTDLQTIHKTGKFIAPEPALAGTTDDTDDTDKYFNV